MISLPGDEFEEREVKGWIIFSAMWAYEVSEADYAKAKQRNHNIIFEFLMQFCKFLFYDFYFIVFVWFGGLHNSLSFPFLIIRIIPQ